MQRYFVTDNYHEQEQFNLKGEHYHHIVRVMRMSPKDQVFLSFANQHTIIAEIIEITESEVQLQELSKETLMKEMPIQITIASGYPKGDKLDWIVQKGTELGAYRFIGYPAKNSVVKWDDKKLFKKQERLLKIAKEAAEQSHRQVVPKVHLLNSFTDFEQLFDQYDAIVIAYEEAAKKGEKAQLTQVFERLHQGAKLLVIFGPEGGITATEIEKISVHGGISAGLGPRILRTETAPLYVLSAASFYYELN